LSVKGFFAWLAIDQQQHLREVKLPMNTGLYRLDEFKDNCGFGLIAHLKGKPSHKLLATGIEALTCMTHRGGIAADGKTGDGCGLLIQKPDSFLRALAQSECQMTLSPLYGVGAVMLRVFTISAGAICPPTPAALGPLPWPACRIFSIYLLTPATTMPQCLSRSC
jgi:hypothetical protein